MSLRDGGTVVCTPAPFTITGGADQALFSIDGTGHLTMTAKNFEAPADADGNNTYVVEVTANDGVNSTPKTITRSEERRVEKAREAKSVAEQAGDENAA